MKNLAIREDNPLQQLKEYKDQQYNVLLPVTHIEKLPTGTLMSVRTVQIIPGSDTYKVQGGMALSGHALDRVASAAGITWTKIERTDNRNHPHYCEITAWAKVTDFDGSVREEPGTVAVDLREDCDGNGTPGPDLEEMNVKAQARGKSASKQILEARKFIVRICESKAKNRAIRHILDIKGAYNTSELQKPFIVPKLVVDTNNQMAQQMMMANMLNGVNALYGNTNQPNNGNSVIDADLTSQPEPAQEETPPDCAPPPSGGESLSPEDRMMK